MARKKWFAKLNMDLPDSDSSLQQYKRFIEQAFLEEKWVKSSSKDTHKHKKKKKKKDKKTKKKKNTDKLTDEEIDEMGIDDFFNAPTALSGGDASDTNTNTNTNDDDEDDFWGNTSSSNQKNDNTRSNSNSDANSNSFSTTSSLADDLDSFEFLVGLDDSTSGIDDHEGIDDHKENSNNATTEIKFSKFSNEAVGSMQSNIKEIVEKLKECKKGLEQDVRIGSRFFDNMIHVMNGEDNIKQVMVQYETRRLEQIVEAGRSVVMNDYDSFKDYMRSFDKFKFLPRQDNATYKKLLEDMNKINAADTENQIIMKDVSLSGANKEETATLMDRLKTNIGCFSFDSNEETIDTSPCGQDGAFLHSREGKPQPAGYSRRPSSMTRSIEAEGRSTKYGRNVSDIKEKFEEAFNVDFESCHAQTYAGLGYGGRHRDQTISPRMLLSSNSESYLKFDAGESGGSGEGRSQVMLSYPNAVCSIVYDVNSAFFEHNIYHQGKNLSETPRDIFVFGFSFKADGSKPTITPTTVAKFWKELMQSGVQCWYGIDGSGTSCDYKKQKY